MASEHLHPSRPYLGRSASDRSNGYSHSFYDGKRDRAREAEPVVDEDQVLCILLAAFPGVSLESIAEAYARADGDPNRAAEILALGNGKLECRKASSQNSKSVKKIDSPEPGRYFAEKGIWKHRVDSETYSTEAEIVHPDDFSSKETNIRQFKNGHGDFDGASVWRSLPILGSSSSGSSVASVPLHKPNSPEDRNDDPLTRRSLSGALLSSRLSPNAQVFEYQGSSRNTSPARRNGDNFAGASFWRDVPILGSNSRPPDSSSVSSVASNSVPSKPNSPEDRSDGPLMRRNDAVLSSKLSPTAQIYEYQGTNKSPQKLSAVAGSVSNQRQRRANETRGNGGCTGLTGESESEVDQDDDGLYSGKLRKKKKKASSKRAGEDLGPGDVAIQRAAEEFLHSMLGGEIGLDVVRDVLCHYAGDTDKALETLLNIGSTSSGFHYSNDTGKFENPLSCVSGFPEEMGLETVELGSLSTTEPLIEGLHGEDDEFNKDLLATLSKAFPTVEHSFLAVVFQAAEFSYEAAVEMLKESGMRPKLDPAEVLQALFKTRTSEPENVASPSNTTAATTEPWSLVVAKPRVRRIPVQVAGERLESNASGEWNEYSRQRTSANEHWVTMKKYMKEATAAYNRGDRSLATLLSEKGARFKELAQEASRRASENIFNVENKDIQNNIMIDLHSQHVMEALQLLKLHLGILSQIPSVHVLTVITGQGSHSAGGRAKIKPAVTKYLDKRQLPWKEVNPGCVLVKLSDVRGVEANQSSDSSSDYESY